MAATLLRIARSTGETAYEERALATLDAFAGELRGAARAHTHLAAALDASLRGGRQIVVVGEPGAEDTRALLRAASARALARMVAGKRALGSASIKTRSASPSNRAWRIERSSGSGLVILKASMRVP